MTDSRLALGRLCALDGRASDAAWWFDAAREVLDAQGARPLRAVVDHDQAVMHLRAGDRAAAARGPTPPPAEFERLGMTGWTRRLARSRALALRPRPAVRPRCDRSATRTADARPHPGTSTARDLDPGDRHDDREQQMKALRLHAYGEPLRAGGHPRSESSPARTT